MIDQTKCYSVTVPFSGTATIVVRAREDVPPSQLRTLALDEYGKLTVQQQDKCCDEWDFTHQGITGHPTDDRPLSEQPTRPLTKKRAERKLMSLFGRALLMDGLADTPWRISDEGNGLEAIESLIELLSGIGLQYTNMADKLRAALNAWRNAI